MPLGYAIPGQTLERVDFFDPRYRTHVALITGASGSGKTVATNALLARNLARGARGYIIDRSSSEDEGGSTRHAGHYEQLARLIPGARVLHLGARERDAVLCPWDVPDPAEPPAGKVEFLLALHTLLIGDPAPHGPGAERAGAPAADPRHRGRLRALRARPASGRASGCCLRSCAGSRASRPQTPTATPSVASELRRLAERLRPYIDDGAARMADRPPDHPRSPARRWCCSTSPGCRTRSPGR